MRNNRVQSHMRMMRQSTTALNVPRTMRPHINPILLRMDPGKAVPIAAAGLFREDAVVKGRLSVAITMDETAEVLLNPVMVRVTAYLVPWLAFDRFAGRDEFEASYSKVPLREGDAVIPFIETQARGAAGAHPVLDALGRHGAPTQQMSTMYIEAYNKIINYRNRNVSLDLPERTRLDSSFAKALRERGRHSGIVSSFDAASMEGVIDIDVVSGSNLPVHGLGHVPSDSASPSSNYPVVETGGATVNYQKFFGEINVAQSNRIFMRADPTTHVPMVNVDIGDAHMQFSLASIDRAKKMQVFANLRKRYNGLDDDAVIAKLMDGITMPDKMFEQPIELGSKLTGFGFSKRFATDSDNLDKSVVSGATMVTMEIATPRINTGGVIMFIAEAQPEMLFERQADPFMAVTDVDDYPQFIRDDGDEQKVEIVYNRDIDTAHANPGGVFGYRPLNDRWRIQQPAIGTGYFQPTPITSFDEDRARIWDTSPANPTLGEDWFLCAPVDKGVFQYSNRQPFEVSGSLELAISGLTVFGGHLIDGADDYEKIDARIPGPDEQIDQ